MRSDRTGYGAQPAAAAAGRGAVALDHGRAGGGSGRSGGSGGGDPRLEGLRTAVSRLRRELAVHPAELRDRLVAEEELAALDAMTYSGAPEVPRLRRSLLVVASAVGSVSALAAALAEVRQVIELFGDIPGPRQGTS